jgi:hypothetical protein
MSTRILYSSTREYLGVIVNANAVLDSDPVSISFDQTNWLAAEWVDVPPDQVLPSDADWLFSRMARVLLGDTNAVPPPGITEVYVTFTDNPEIPVMLAGKVLVQ